jgi:hypothetical protein
MIYTGQSGAYATYRIGLATSTNGYSWTKSASNPVLTGTSSWELIVRNGVPISKIESYGVIKVDGTYYLWYNTLGTGGARQIGLATSTNLISWTKDGNNPIFASTTYPFGCFCAFPFKHDSYYYLLVPHYTSGTNNNVKFDLWRDSSPTFYQANRINLGVAIDFGAPSAWDSRSQDTACVLTDDITRSTFPDDQFYTYYSGEYAGVWKTGLAIGANPVQTITMNGAHAVSDAAKTQYKLTVSTSPLAISPQPTITLTSGYTTNDGWYDAGSVASINPGSPLGWKFDHWSGDASGSTVPLRLTMNFAKNIVAVYISI